LEEGLVALVRRLPTEREGERKRQQRLQQEPPISLARQHFLVPDRGGLPALHRYAHVNLGNGEQRIAGYTEATRGCKHLCRHCPIVPVYGGRFRIVQPDVVLEDIQQQVVAGAQHITFGDPDFFNGPTHALRIVQELHQRFPHLTYDVTIKIEHLVKHARHVPTLRETGCLFVTSAVESVDNHILEIFDKLHTREDFIQVVSLFRDVGLALNPTFVTFTPWTTLQGYVDLLKLFYDLDLVENIAPVQYAIRLLIPAGSRLLELQTTRDIIGEFDEEALSYPWVHADPRVDQLYVDVLATVKESQAHNESRRAIFKKVWKLALTACLQAHEAIERMAEYMSLLDSLGVSEWVDFDLSIVRGLAYYTGTVFELFDASGEFRAICGGGRYDDLLEAIGGAALPALGFGMGDVVIGELLRARGLILDLK